MDLPPVGSVVFVPFPYADFSRIKNRPVLVLAHAEQASLIVCQITSKAYSSQQAIVLEKADFARGGLPLTSYARIDKSWTLESTAILGELGELRATKRHEVLQSVRSLFV